MRKITDIFQTYVVGGSENSYVSRDVPDESNGKRGEGGSRQYLLTKKKLYSHKQFTENVKSDKQMTIEVDTSSSRAVGESNGSPCTMSKVQVGMHETLKIVSII
jgi:hypothetical protein